MLNSLKALFYKVFPITEEDKVINEAHNGNIEPLVRYFTENKVKFTRIDHRRWTSPTGRVVYEEDCYSTLYIDKKPARHWFEEDFPYDTRMEMKNKMMWAILGNVPNTTYYEKKMFGVNK